MILYPAIDMLGGRAVRLRQGSRDAKTDYGSPLDMAEKWKALGARSLHIVDLDGAFTGEAGNLPILREIAEKSGLFIELGGGIRTMEDIRLRIDCGVSRVILGTAAVENPELVKSAVKQYGDKIAVGIDAKDGIVMTRGWLGKSGLSAVDFALSMREIGVKTIIYTDISRDGMLIGPNLERTREMVEKTNLDVIGSGGVSSAEDIAGLRKAGCAGAITGKAIYEGTLSISEALAEAEG
ncbi:MAG: 1-(5-phosphoribosyl)-5-[(5-phosphoribosylamino)methylideneamino]imidazole-4-carboxamide isomerase [Eubacteriales bacterium]|nr:1-(5-phosphoribosyl)-5-[(5-phosphoribosylamino)methylideneamino]imidazole-4-carboxamide isomerase [Eubacteriales bacterium]MDD3880659.1 1-(5-phosphoribosyl)-5-[(5-phosphoribosylamino)methylideneamino]imidazole-4-carboxamide isomerase [Eubacteriales bacterium]MDD4513564.1 1-(5-phosphoribosyl)-5-[(5-phosphoribosylamino)methylideneamino]imidazole-4-carboxamide isomerase [Eubacteriales bacterium]